MKKSNLFFLILVIFALIIMFLFFQTDATAHFLINPFVIPILLTVGCIGLVLELFTPGFGIPGIIGICALLLFYFGHLVAGSAGIEVLVLFIVGLILMILEFFLPGAIVGILGIIAIIASLFIASGDVVLVSVSLIIAFVLTVVVLYIMIKVLKKKIHLFNKIVLSDATSTEKGYVTNPNRTELLGAEGVALTTLRPSGTALLNDERIDVVTEGGYIEKDETIKVIKVEGARIVVRKIDQ